MKNINEAALREQRKKALKLAEIKATDAEDLEECVSDMQKHASLDEGEARIVAAAIRAKHLPNLVRESGLEDLFEDELETPVAHEGVPTADFAKDKAKDLDEAEPADVDEAEESNDDSELPIETEDIPEDTSEVDDTDIATFQIEVPADKADAAQQVVQEALEKLLGGDSVADDPDMDADSKFEELDGDMDDEGMEMPEDAEKTDEAIPHTASKKVNTMTKKAMAERRAQREALLKRTIVAEDAKPKDKNLGADTSEGTYMGEKAKSAQFDSEAQYRGEQEYPKMTMQGSEGNSLKADNPTYARQPVPTKNPNNIQLGGSIDAVTLEGSEDGTLEYTVDFDHLDNVPSADADRDPAFEVPTQMEQKPRNTTVASRKVECMGCNNPDKSEVNIVECGDCKKAGLNNYRVAICLACEEEGYCPSCAARVSTASEKTAAPDVNIEVKAEDEAEGTTHQVDERVEKATKEAELDKARIKTAYACSYKLAGAKLISMDEADAYAEQMLAENLPAPTMIRQTTLLLRSAQSNAERVAAAASEKFNNVRTASTNVGLSTTPALGGSPANGAALDIQAALRGSFTMPRIDED